MKKIIVPFFCAVLFSTSAVAQKTATTTAVSSGTATSAFSSQQVLDNYIKALGGKEKLENVKSFATEDVISVQGMEIGSTTKKMGNKFKSVQSVMGREIVSVFDGEKGYSNQTGSKVDFPSDKIVELKKGKTIDALGFEASKYVSAVEPLDGKNYNVLVSDTGKLYFDTTTGLLYKAGNNKGGATMKSYMTVDGIKFPEIIEAEGGGQKVIIKTTKITINSGVSEVDFK